MSHVMSPVLAAMVLGAGVTFAAAAPVLPNLAKTADTLIMKTGVTINAPGGIYVDVQWGDGPVKVDVRRKGKKLVKQ